MSSSIPIFGAAISVALISKWQRQADDYDRRMRQYRERLNLLNAERAYRQKVLDEQTARKRREDKKETRRRLANTRASLVSRGLTFSPGTSGGTLLRSLEDEGYEREDDRRSDYGNAKYAEDLRYRRNLLSLSAPSYPNIFKGMEDYLDI